MKKFTKQIKTKITSLLVGSFLCAGLHSPAQEFMWAKQHGSFGTDVARQMSADENGNNYTLASFEGTITVGAQTMASANGDQVLVKYNSAGNLQWAMQVNTAVTEMKARGGFLYLCGAYKSGSSLGAYTFTNTTTTGDGFVIRMAPSGSVDLVIDINGPDYQSFSGLDVDASGNIYAAGRASGTTYMGTTQLEAGYNAIFLARYSSTGALTWMRSAMQGTNSTMSAMKVVVNNDGTNITLLGRASGSSETVTFSNASTLTYKVSDTQNGNEFFAKYDGSGNLSVVKEAPTSLFKRGFVNMGIDGAGNLYFGETYMYNNFKIMKFSPSYQLLWAKLDPANTHWAELKDLEVDVHGNVYIAGTVLNEGVFSGDTLHNIGAWAGFVAKYNTMGQMMWVTGVTTSEAKEASFHGLGLDALGDIYVSGAFEATARVKGVGSFTAVGKTDIMIAKLQGNSSYESVAENRANGVFSFYPNPNAGSFVFEASATGGSVVITDLLGKQVVNQSLDNTGKTEISADLQPGIYILSYYKNNTLAGTHKMVVEK